MSWPFRADGYYEELIAKRNRLAARLTPAARHRVFPALYPRPAERKPKPKIEPVTDLKPKAIQAYVGWRTKPGPQQRPVDAKVAGEIIRVVCELWGIRFEGLISPARYRKNAWARFAAVRLMRTFDRMASSTQIGRVLNRDHTTILAAIQRAEELFEGNASWRALYDKALAKLTETA